MFPRGIYTPEPSFNALFRLLDDFDSYSRDVSNGNANGHGHHHRRHVRTFNPRFDVVETDAAYELHGDLAGVEKDNVQLEFTDPQTLVVRGRIERKYEAGTPPTAAPAAAPAVEDVQMSGALPEKEGEWQDVEPHSPTKEHQASVEDEKDETETTATAEAPTAATPATTSTEVVKPAEKAAAAPAAPKNNRKYWVSERSVGEFSRTFSFPSRIEQDGVTASLNNGILTVSVPKAKKYESRRVTVN